MLTSNDLANMQAAQEIVMLDTCDLLIKFETDRADAYGAPVFEWITETTINCGLDLRASREMLNAEMHVYDARLRLPIDTEISRIDRVHITHRHGVLLADPIDFDLIGEPRRGPSGLLIDLRSVTNV